MIVIVNYGMGNVASIANMVRKCGGAVVASGDPAIIAEADKLILPGVGAFDHGMANLGERGLIPVLNRKVVEHQVPILGLCLGMQLFTRKSDEGTLPGLGWVGADTRRFRFASDQKHLKVPHMGWNFIEPAKPRVLLHGLPPEPKYYFAHSYHLVCDESADVLTWTTYGYRFVSAIQCGNIYGTQFHPEKSHTFGLALIKNFLSLS